MSKLYFNETGRVIPTLCEELSTFRRARTLAYGPESEAPATLYLLARAYPESGTTTGFHGASHHAENPANILNYSKINTYHVTLFSYLVEKLKATPDGDGSLLDHTTYLLGSGMGNPDVHDHTNLPIVVAGGGAGTVKGGRHIKYAKPTPLGNLHVTLLDRVGIHQESFGDSDGRVEELL